jgi:hypothetical protein
MEFSDPHDAALGIPPWARFVRYANAINSILAVLIAIYLSFTISFWRGLGYAIAFFVVQIIFIALTSIVSERAGKLAMLLVSTAFLICLNIVLAFWVFR